jgi:hypothetical protein
VPKEKEKEKTKFMHCHFHCDWNYDNIEGDLFFENISK